MFTQVGDLIKTLPKRSKTPDAIVALHVRRAFFDSLKKVCGDLPESVLKTARPTSFKKGVLTVKSPGLMSSELQMRAGGLMRDINETLGKKIVRSLRFRSF
ncbi:hypothetical protein A2870_04085 [Candidatus Curtissbacteria bacterium RIFCSPHIGHO2_01_FULL_41_11]|uniref:Uncharacterized protein n=1 Tax=Candidatus Curtissbacteria bacterium RIFCSPHIGHO2_01_FULL_41_11 TaxID=1797711 RepID=A0A1F5G6K4_9BACT|nr:MAG: hypothetical protein A2870_04085 [Candidatus Curtissbacteria bacterium RIFCSPHIGHO2_01_FULL_41_11]